VLEGGFEVEVVPGTIVGDLLGIVGVLVVTVILGGRDADQIRFRGPDFDRRVQQVARIDRHSPDIAALEGPALVELMKFVGIEPFATLLPEKLAAFPDLVEVAKTDPA
jgi:hypothetical protein